MAITLSHAPPWGEINHQEWNALAARNDTNTVFQSWEWLQAWDKTYGGQQRPVSFKLGSGGGTVGYAPLTLSREKSGLRVIRFAASKHADYCDFLCPDNTTESLGEVVAALLNMREAWDRIVLENIPQSSPTVNALAGVLREKGMRHHVNHNTTCHALRIDGTNGTAADYGSRKTVRRRYNYFRRTGQLEYRILTTENAVRRHLPIFFKQHSERWQGAKPGLLFSDSLVRDFYLGVARGLLPQQWLHFSVLLHQDRPIAYHFGFDYEMKMLWYKPSFDLRYRKHSPGKVMLKYLIEDCIARGRKELDLTVGDEPFKQEISDTQRQNVQFVIFNSLIDYNRYRSVSYVRSLARRLRSVYRKKLSHRGGRCRSKRLYTTQETGHSGKD